MAAKKRSEEFVATQVMNWMTGRGWDCYPEVVMPTGRADIVGVRPFPFMPGRKCVHVVECKTSWTLTLLEQAVERAGYAHYVTLAAPTTPGNFYERICKSYGFGMISFNRDGDINEYMSIEPRLFRHKKNKWKSGPDTVLGLLHDDMKKYTPGSVSSKGYSTPWARTMDACEEYVRKNPGCGVKDILENVDHHYSSNSGARQGVLLWLTQKRAVVTVQDGKKYLFYPAEAKNP